MSRHSPALAAVLALLGALAHRESPASTTARGAPRVPFRHHVVEQQGPRDPWVKVTGDLDGDGRLDLVVGGRKGPLVWYRSPGWDRHPIADGGYSTVDGATGDMDGDGDRDVALGGTVWFENPGGLASDPARPWPRHVVAEHPTHDVELADLDGDGRLDVVTRDQTEFARAGHAIHVFRRTTDERWAETVLSCPEGEGLAAADIDADGDPDLVIAGVWFETVREPGGFSFAAHDFGRFEGSASVAVGDVDGDSRPDVVAAPSERAGQRGRLAWFQSPPDPLRDGWREHVIDGDVERVLHSLDLADVDGDGRLDVVLAEMHQGEDPDEVAVLFNLGQGLAWTRQVVATTGSHSLRAADLDADGDVDLFGANWSGQHQAVEVWESLRAPLAILGALDAEIRPVLEALADREPTTLRGIPVTTGTLDGRPVVVAATGVGKVNAAMTTALVIERFAPAAVLFTGVAGALDPDLQPGDVVVGEKLVQHDLVRHTDEGPVLRTVRSPRDGAPGPLTLEPASRLLALAREVAGPAERGLAAVEGTARPPRLVFGTIATGDSFVSSRARKAELHERLAAHAVEMEGAAVAQVCRELGVPVLVVRGLSDRASGDASAEARRNLAVAAGNAAEAALALARRLGPEGP